MEPENDRHSVSYCVFVHVVTVSRMGKASSSFSSWLFCPFSTTENSFENALQLMMLYVCVRVGACMCVFVCVCSHVCLCVCLSTRVCVCLWESSSDPISYSPHQKPPPLLTSPRGQQRAP